MESGGTTIGDTGTRISEAIVSGNARHVQPRLLWSNFSSFSLCFFDFMCWSY